MGLAGTDVAWRPVLTICWLSSWCSSGMYSSCHWQGSSLGISTYSVWYTCLATPRISWLVDPRRVLMEEYSRIVSLSMPAHCMWGHLLVCLSCSLLCIAAALWSRCSNRKNPHFWQWAVLPTWVIPLELIQVQLTPKHPFCHPFEHPVLKASCFAHSPKAAKLSYCSVTNSSILQWSMMHVVTILIQK